MTNRIYGIAIFLFLLSGGLAAQNVSLIIEKATFNTKLKWLQFKISVVNHSKDTVHVLDSESYLFQRTNLQKEQMGLQKLPYTIVSKKIPGCQVNPNAIEVDEPRTWRKLIQAVDFIALAPGEKKTLNDFTIDAEALCMKTIPTAPVSIALSYQVIKADKKYFSEDEMKDLLEAKSELEIAKREIDALNGKVKFSTQQYLNALTYYANYNANIGRLTGDKLTTEVVMVVTE